jgi:hypothetical protein
MIILRAVAVVPGPAVVHIRAVVPGPAVVHIPAVVSGPAVVAIPAAVPVPAIVHTWRSLAVAVCPAVFLTWGDLR